MEGHGIKTASREKVHEVVVKGAMTREYQNSPVASSRSPPISSGTPRIPIRILTSCSRGKAGREIGRHIGLLPRVVLCRNIAIHEWLLSSGFVGGRKGEKGLKAWVGENVCNTDSTS